MSSSKAIAIPKPKGKQIAGSEPSAPSIPCYNSNSNRYSFGSSTYGSTPSTSPESMKRRESLMSAAFSAQEHTVINVGEEECPRLITCVKASQGFDWNQEIFLPSYADYHFDDLERRQDPVEDIVVTDEEVRTMFPQ